MYKNKKVLYISLLVLTLMLMLLTVGYFYLSSKYSANKLTSYTISKIKEIFPDSKVTIGNVEMSVGGALKAHISTLVIKNKNIERPLLSVNDLTVRVPLLSIFLGGGNIEFLLERPQIFYYENNGSNNWRDALSKELQNNKEISFRKEMVIPLFLANSTVSLRSRNALVEYKLKNEMHGLFNIEKFLVKNLGIYSNAAFEISTEVRGSVKMYAMVIGSFNIGDYLRNKKLDFRSILRLTDIEIPSLSTVIPRLNANITSTLNTDGSLEGSFKSKYEKSSIDINYTLKNRDLNFTKIKGNVFLDEFITSRAAEEDTLLIIEGTTLFSKNKFVPKLNLTLQNFKWRFAGNEIDSDLTLKLTEREFDLSSSSNIFEGIAKLNVAGDVLFNEDISLDKRISNIKGSLLLENNVLSEDIFKGDYYPSLNQTALIPTGSIDIEFKNVILADDKVNGHVDLVSRGDSLAFNKIQIKVGEGSVSGSDLIKIYESKLEHQIDLNIQSLNIDPMKKIFSSKISRLEGLYSASIKGPLVFGIGANKDKKYQIKYSVRGVDGFLMGDGIRRYISSLEGVLKSVDIADYPIRNVFDGSFDYLEVNGILEDQAYYIESIDIGMKENKVKLTGNGIIYTGTNNSKRSEIFLTLDDNVGITTLKGKIPLLFKGSNYALKPDYQYTMGKILKKLIKKNKKNKGMIKNGKQTN